MIITATDMDGKFMGIDSKNIIYSIIINPVDISAKFIRISLMEDYNQRFIDVEHSDEVVKQLIALSGN